ncbi:riboflavin kinase [archaeon SCG-AAA382B04]|nr:riboflavin kinase [archaeon SCG-AAA382B04]
MDEKLLKLLKKLALKNDLSLITTASLSKDIDSSAQTLSRWLKQMEQRGLIERRIHPRGQSITITDEGWNKLRDELYDYKRIFNEGDSLVLTGEITEGMGEGQYYISKENYQKQFEKKLGFKPFPGTLNVVLDSESVKKTHFLRNKKGILVEGFEEEERSFGDVKCFRSLVNDIESAIIFPNRSSYEDNIIELISKHKLRDKLDSENVEIEVKNE